MPNEDWRPVVGFEGLYEVSSLGRLKRIGKAPITGKGHGGGAVIGRIMAQSIVRNGYLRVLLCKMNRQTGHFAHRLVALAFLPPQEGRHYVNHKDGNKQNNALANLEWVTHSENIKHGYQQLGRVVTERQLVNLAKARSVIAAQRRLAREKRVIT